MMFSTQTYQNRRTTLVNKIDSGLILLLGNIENPINFAHNTYPFRQDSTFLYYFGIQVPRLAAILDIDENKTIVFGNEMSIDDIVWMGRQETLADKSMQSGISDTRPLDSLYEYIAQALQKKRKIHYLPPYQPANKILLSRLLHIPLEQIDASVPLIKAVVSQRAIKEEQEIVQIEEAIRVSVEMHLLAMKMAKPGIKEYEIANAIQYLAADRGCRMAYPPIVSIHGEILHNHYQLNILQSGNLLLNDSGAETGMGYAGDLTRTFPVDKTFTTKQKDIYNIVLQSFSDARDILRPGLNYQEVHWRAARSLVEGLIGLGLMKGDPEKAVKAHAHTLFFQCGTGHMMGLDVHDMEDLGEQYVGYTEEQPKDTQILGLKSLRLGKPLEPGYVLTVEPGIYFIPELIDLWQSTHKNSSFINYDKVNAYRDFGGVRIEDDFLITRDGYRLLGPELIKTVKEIEDFRRNE